MMGSRGIMQDRRCTILFFAESAAESSLATARARKRTRVPHPTNGRHMDGGSYIIGGNGLPADYRTLL